MSNAILSREERLLAHAKAFPEYQNSPNIKVGRFIDVPEQICETSDSESKALYETIFAPDPVTGNPQSDLAYIMSKDKRPEVAQFIRDNLMQPLPDTASIDDPDLAMEAIKGRNEDIVSYGERLRQIISGSKDNES